MGWVPGLPGLGNLAGPYHLVRLRSFLSLDDIELHVVAFLQALIPIYLNSAVVDEHVGSVVTADKPVSFRVIEPLDLAFVLSHKNEPSSQADYGWVANLACLIKTRCPFLWFSVTEK